MCRRLVHYARGETCGGIAFGGSALRGLEVHDRRFALRYGFSRVQRKRWFAIGALEVRIAGRGMHDQAKL